MPRRLIRRIATAASRPRRAPDRLSQAHFEHLEPRILFSATSPAFILDIVADNRGLITMEVCGELLESTLNDTSVRVFTAGADNLFGTFDDVTEARTISYDAETGELIIEAQIDAGVRYGVMLDASIVRDVNGFFFDGEFNGASMATGNGLSGGDLLFYTKAAPIQTARITTNLGNIDIELFTVETPISVANFLNYANAGRFDNVIFHRSVMDFVIQGGGYENELGFDRIDRDPAILNEPGISNLRGTIAFARTANQVNSATSEWFLNLGDNTSNLDNQNGGFTVFGEITDQAGLDVMDAIAALETVDASGIDSAFTDLPVTDVDALNGNPGAVTPALTVSIDRVALIQTLSATPPEQLQAESFTFTSNRDVFVTVYDLGGIGRDELDNAIEVKFSGNRVSSINISGDFPAGSLGIVIGNANRVGVIKDAGANTSVAFIFSNAPVAKINLKGDITGLNINGLNLGGILLPDDIDGDGVFTDQTAILINSGTVVSLNAKGDIHGDILIPGGLSSLQLRGVVTNSDIRIGASSFSETEIKARIADAQNTNLFSETPFGQLRIDNWTADADNNVLDVPSIRKLTLRGAFDVDVNLTGAMDPTERTLGKFIAINGLFGASFEINGDTGLVLVKGDTAQIMFNATGTIAKLKLGDVLSSTFTSGSSGETVRSVKLGALTDTTIDFEGEIRNFRAKSASGGLIKAAVIRTLKITDRHAELTADITLTGGGPFGGMIRVANTITINGEITGGMWTLSGSVKSIRIQDARDAEILVNGSLDIFVANDLERFDLGIQGVSKNVTTGTWFRGEAAITSITRFTVNGDFRANISATNAQRINITGDLFIADLFFTQQPDFFGTYALRSLTVGGEMRDVEFRAAFRIGTIQARAMHNTIIGISNNIPNNEFPLPSDVDSFSSIESVTITGPRNGPANFTDSYIIASQIGSVILGEVKSFNSGHDFGVGANNLDSITYFADGERITLRNNALDATPEPFGDFEVRINFLRFDENGA